jgi:hypothetical protein
MNNFWNEIWLAFQAAVQAYIPAAWDGGAVITGVYGFFVLALTALLVTAIIWIVDGAFERLIRKVWPVPVIGWALGITFFVIALFVTPLVMTWVVLIFLPALRPMPWVYFVVIPIVIIHLAIGIWHYRNTPWLPAWMKRAFHFLTRNVFNKERKAEIAAKKAEALQLVRKQAEDERIAAMGREVKVAVETTLRYLPDVARVVIGEKMLVGETVFVGPLTRVNGSGDPDSAGDWVKVRENRFIQVCKLEM